MGSGLSTAATAGIWVACVAVAAIGFAVCVTKSKNSYTDKLKADARIQYADDPQMLQQVLEQIDREARFAPV